MLTAFQCEVVAGYTEYGDILCLSCAEDEWTKPLIRYALDEEQVARNEGVMDDPRHVEYCGCLYALECDSCTAELVEAYDDPDCEEDKR